MSLKAFTVKGLSLMFYVSNMHNNAVGQCEVEKQKGEEFRESRTE